MVSQLIEEGKIPVFDALYLDMVRAALCVTDGLDLQR